MSKTMLKYCNNKILFFQTNFQAVVVTDEKISFAIFLYDEKDLGNIMVPSAMGFSAADHQRRIHTSSGGVQKRFFRIDGLFRYIQSNLFW